MGLPTLALGELASLAGRRVLVTGHTGFKGSWLAHWLLDLGAEVAGLALPVNTDPALFELLGLENRVRHTIGDVRDVGQLRAVIKEFQPEVVFHLAAQALVRESYADPLGTITTNVVGVANLLEALRLESRGVVAIMVTSDKCYENREWAWGYRENDPMGGHDPYSMSKGAAELVIASYRRSYFAASELERHGVAVASVRAGNVIGGGDWARDRLVPDAIRALASDAPILVRSPNSIRPWQHVLEPLGGYMLLASRMLSRGDRAHLCDAWNFGPRPDDAQPVARVVEAMVSQWGGGSWRDVSDPGAVHEAGSLRLSIDKACTQLGWAPRWSLDDAVSRTVEWYRAWHSGASTAELGGMCSRQIWDYLEVPTD